MLHTLQLQLYQYDLINEVLIAENAIGSGSIYNNDGSFLHNYKYDNSADFEQIKKNIKTVNNCVIAELSTDNIELLTDLLHDIESDLVVATNTPAIRNESFEKLQLVCKTIDYLDSFVEEVE